MKHTSRILILLLLVPLVGNLPLLAETENVLVSVWDEPPFPEVGAFGLRYETEVGPVDLPPWLPAPEVTAKVLNLSTSVAIGNGSVGNVSTVSPMANMESSAAQAIPGSRAGSFMSEQRLAERSLRGTIKRLG